MKTIEELAEQAEYLQSVIAYYTADEQDHRNEANRSAAEKVKYRRELDDIERQLISAQGEPS